MLSKNFSRIEFKCKCLNCDYDTVDAELVSVLQALRDHFGSSVMITSGNRCPEYNRKVDGAKDSKHITGRAADIVVKNIPAHVVQDYLKDTYKDKYGIGSYALFTHIDTRTIAARWTG